MAGTGEALNRPPRDFGEAQKAWAGAERAAATDQEREHIHQVRLDVQDEAVRLGGAERKRVKDEKEADLERVKAQSEAAIRAAEDAARKKINPDGAPLPAKPQVWYGRAER